MPVYWSMLIVTIIIAFLSYGTSHKEVIIENQKIKKTRLGYALVTFLYVIFFIGLRDQVLDTAGYISSFNAIPVNWKEMLSSVNQETTGKGFYLMAGIFKILISQNHYAWLTFLCAVSCLCLLRTWYKYSVDFPLTAYLFIASTTFTWLLNGTRQFLAACILFAFIDWLIQGKKLRYIVLTLAVSTIHASAIFVIPVSLFVSSRKILDKKMVLLIILTIIGTRYSEFVLNYVNIWLDNDYSNVLMTDNGSNFLRLIVAMVPIIITLVCYKSIFEKAPSEIKLAINMSLVGDCFYFASTFTNGILVGRMPIYFTIYNLYLIPWLIKYCFSKTSQTIITIACVLLYGIYFYFQMVVSWGGLMYISNILRINSY